MLRVCAYLFDVRVVWSMSVWEDVCWLPISQLFVVPSRASVSAWRCAGPRQSQHILGVAARVC